MQKRFSLLLCSPLLALATMPLAADEPVDVVLIGGGIMSATLGTYLQELESEWNIHLYERLDQVAEESSNAWNNAGTGHSAFCEMNYTPEQEDGSVEIQRAINVTEQFEVSRQFWSHQVENDMLAEPTSFISTVPHASLVWAKMMSLSCANVTPPWYKTRCTRTWSTQKIVSRLLSGCRW